MNNGYTKLDIVTCDSGDWYGLYTNGELEYEGHGLYEWVWIELIEKYQKFNNDVGRYEISDELMEMGLPRYFVDLEV